MNKSPDALPIKDTIAPFLRLCTSLGWPLEPSSSRRGIPYIDRPLALAIAGQGAISMAEPFGSFGGRTLPKGMAISNEGRVFLADPKQSRILTALAGVETLSEPGQLSPFVPLWSKRMRLEADSKRCANSQTVIAADPYTLVEPVDVAISARGDLLILDRGARRILVLVFPSARLRRVIELNEGTPEAIAFDEYDNLYVALSDPGTIRRYDRLLRKDTNFPRVELNQPVALAAAKVSLSAYANHCESHVVREAVIHVIDDGHLLSLDAKGFKVDTEENTLELAVPPLVREEHHVLSWQDPEMPRHDPIRFHGIKLDSMGCHQGSSRPILALPRRVEVPRTGRFTTTALDSGQTGFQWDRLTFDIDLPTNGRVIVSTLTSEVEVPFERLETIPDDRWSRPLVLLAEDLPEVLVQSGPGRFLWLHVELSGDGTTSPLIRGIDIYGPRRSSLRYLPAPFHDDPESKYFLDRFLSYFDTIFAEISGQHRNMAEIFDSSVAPLEFLSWLGKWFDLDFLAAWPEATRRQMLAEVIPYYRQRGTVPGLRRILQWHCGLIDPLPQIIEHFRFNKDHADKNDHTGMIGGEELDLSSLAHSFTVVLPAYLATNYDSRKALERLIDASIPAHTNYKLRLIEPGLTIGRQSTIGIDTILGPMGGGALGTGRLGKTMSTKTLLPDAPIHFPHNLIARIGEGAL